jgi:two-component system phosphate regulon sensor histidine kinase PhoR
MRSSTTRFLILSFTLLIVALIGIQLYWVNKTYSFEQHNFHTAVIKSIRGIYEDINMVSDPASRLDKLIEHPNPDTYLFRADALPIGDTLVNYMKYEFDDFNVYTECNIGIYQHKTDGFTYRNHVSFAGPGSATKLNELPIFKKDHDYICLYFPNRNLYVLSQMNEWIVTSVLIMLLLGGLSFSLYYFFRQKFLNEVQKDFINNVTHEFSTPLAVIELSTDALERSSNQPEAYRINKYASTIRYQTEYLKKHIHALMKTLVAENHPFKLNMVPVNINVLIRNTVAQLEPLIAEKKGRVTLELEESNVEVQADQDNLYLAIFNIVNNALKYSVHPRVFIKTFIDKGTYHILVQDNGIGIDQKDIKNIFRKFYRAQDGNIHQVKGLGLGLYFARNVINKHHGEVQARSVPGEGSIFTVILPV